MALPVDPPPSRWAFPPASSADPDGIVAVGGDLRPGTVLAAYRQGLFPMPIQGHHLAWWSPDPRGVIPLDGLHVPRSLRRSCQRMATTVDAAFPEVIERCADRRRPGAWISGDIRRAYEELHRLGWAHSVEAWLPEGTLAGGLYGVSIGGFFAGESMFHTVTDGSKVALVALVAHLRSSGASLLDVQWTTPHLASMGAVDVDRNTYLRMLAEALARPQVPW